uniref:Agenet domain-containing protein n=1 Tax=Meloidogyne hapla TaxID=6305 RepID=A0A1I8BPB0_MELHA
MKVKPLRFWYDSTYLVGRCRMVPKSTRYDFIEESYGFERGWGSRLLKQTSEEKMRRKNGKHGGGDDYQTLAGLDGDMFVRGRRTRSPRNREKVLRDDPMPFTQSDIKLPGKSLLSKDTLRSRQSVASNRRSNMQSKGASLFV